MSTNPVVCLRVQISDADLLSCREIMLTGRKAWALDQLIRAGDVGCTPISNPAPRWSDAVFKLKKHGLDIETKHEAHGGAYAGHHGRYILRTPVQVIETKRQGDGRGAA